MKIQLHSSVLFVSDIDVSRKFYVEVLNQEIELDFGSGRTACYNYTGYDDILRGCVSVNNSRYDQTGPVFSQTLLSDEIYGNQS